MIRILIADDHAMIRHGIKGFLGSANGIRIVAEACDGWEVLRFLREGSYDMLLLDLSMPGPSGIELVKRAHQTAPRLPILVYSMHDESQIVGRAIRAGAAGYLSKSVDPDMLQSAVRRIATGGRFIEPTLASQMVFDGVEANGDEAPHMRLSDREYDIFLRLARGQIISEIARALNLSPNTVSTHKSRLLRKLGLKSVSDLVRYAIEHDLMAS